METPIVGDGDDAPDGLEVGQGIDFLAAVDAENSAADEKERDIGADLGGGTIFSIDELIAFLGLTGDCRRFDWLLSSASSPTKRGDGVARAGAQATLDGQPLFDMDLDFCH